MLLTKRNPLNMLASLQFSNCKAEILQLHPEKDSKKLRILWPCLSVVFLNVFLFCQKVLIFVIGLILYKTQFLA